jgi:hypothetical protein
VRCELALGAVNAITCCESGSAKERASRDVVMSDLKVRSPENQYGFGVTVVTSVTGFAGGGDG